LLWVKADSKLDSFNFLGKRIKTFSGQIFYLFLDFDFDLDFALAFAMQSLSLHVY
jgi:hypothetical protein